VDNAPTQVNFWVGANHSAAIVRLEPMDAPATPTSAGR
jgi:hypothetical protein